MGECHRMKCCLCAKVSRYERMLSTSGWLIISALLTSVSGKESRSFFLHEFGYTACSMAKIYEIDGAVVRTHVGPDTPYPSYPTTCDLQFETRTNRKRFMIRFDLLDINDCDDVLTVWNGYIAAQRVLATISCENKTSDVLYTSSSHLGLSFTTNSGGAEGKGFEAVITAFDDGVNDPKKCFYGDFHCDNGKCIDAKLNCDLINHCEDWSDERGNADCAHQEVNLCNVTD
ncbi:PREDICTED: enteropeptidase-like [Priapulus caudatus]|uniref:Enteropeptidase-like n=1 Tax=Priapulus caudatus TaxID=37621 RepID=A0ABM1EUP8_PRICU|nr:PREDICTED: enteropeptidase-like [Priapulus caudatus]